MDNNTTFSIIVSIPVPYADVLYKLANDHNEKNPHRFLTIEEIISDAVCEYVDRIEQMEAALQPSIDHNKFSVKEDTM